jgi:predicted nucleic acid-binding protein
MHFPLSMRRIEMRAAGRCDQSARQRGFDSCGSISARAFIQDLLADVEVVCYTKETALLAEKIDGECSSQGVTIPSIDLLIGATALEHGYSIATVNLRHFRLIPSLNVLQL